MVFAKFGVQNIICLRELLLDQYHVIDIQIFCVFNVPFIPIYT